MFPFVSEAMAQSASGAAPITQSALFQFIPFILIFVVFYFLIIRPQQKKQKTLQSMLAALQKGDQVVTNGGIHGTINKVGDDWLTLEISEKVLIKIERNQIARLVVDEQKSSK